MKIVVGATAAGHKHREASKWLTHARAMQAITPHDIRFFLTAEVQPSGLEPRLDAIAAQVKALGGEVWKFMIDDRSDQITNATRMIRICEGRNLITEFALRERADWILYVDADIIIPPDVINKLLQIGQKFCGFNVPSYCLSGEVAAGFGFPVQIYQNTAGAWFLHRSVFRFFRWLWDPDDGLTDDPATYRIIRNHLGLAQYNRLDVCGEHTPLIPFEARDIDVLVRRSALDGHPLTAVIPVYFAAVRHVEMTSSILQRVLEEQVSRVYVVYNGGEMPYCAQGMDVLERYSVEEGDRVKMIPALGETIYQLWNIGWRQSLEDFGDEVLIAFLNNDIDFLPGTLELLAKAVLPNEIWVTYPDSDCRVQDGARLTGRTIATRGTKRHGGMTGHCFLIKGGIHTIGGFPLFDGRYRCWYGDDDFAFRVNRYGFQIHRVEGLPCDHLNEATMQYRPDLMAEREKDRQRFVEEWGDI
jgi:hypothetical protein